MELGEKGWGETRDLNGVVDECLDELMVDHDTYGRRGVIRCGSQMIWACYW